MLSEYIQLMTTLGVIIMLILLLVILPLLLSIRKQQKKNINCLEVVSDNIVKLISNVTGMAELINTNFKDIGLKVVSFDSKQISTKDMVKSICDFLEYHHSQTMTAIKDIKVTNISNDISSVIKQPSNTPRKSYKPRKQRNTPTKDNRGS